MAKKDVKIEMTPQYLTIEGERKEEKEEKREPAERRRLPIDEPAEKKELVGA